MNLPKDDKKPADSAELQKPPAATCGSGCGCHSTGKPGKTRWLIGALVLAAAGVMVVRAMIKNDGASFQTSASAFAALAASQTSADGSSPTTNSGAAAPAAGTSVGTDIGAFSELNTVATKLDAVFVFLPGKEANSGNPPSSAMNDAVRTLASQGVKCGLFTLKTGSRDYDQIAGRISLPGVLAMVKGHGMNAISGDITESKLVEGYVAALSAGGCDPSAGAGCCPK